MCFGEVFKYPESVKGKRCKWLNDICSPERRLPHAYTLAASSLDSQREMEIMGRKRYHCNSKKRENRASTVDPVFWENSGVFEEYGRRRRRRDRKLWVTRWDRKGLKRPCIYRLSTSRTEKENNHSLWMYPLGKWEKRKPPAPLWYLSTWTSGEEKTLPTKIQFSRQRKDKEAHLGVVWSFETKREAEGHVEGPIDFQ